MAVSRKIEFWEGDLNIKLFPVMLTVQQCVEYELPRTPLKESERRTGAFEDRHGEGATELDALEALHPGEFARILKEELDRYFDHYLAENLSQEEYRRQAELDEFTCQIHSNFSDEIETLREEYGAIKEMFEEWKEDAEKVWHAISSDLEGETPDFAEEEWPESGVAEERNRPLYDSSRTYLEQLKAYREHQGRDNGEGNLP